MTRNKLNESWTNTATCWAQMEKCLATRFNRRWWNLPHQTRVCSRLDETRSPFEEGLHTGSSVGANRRHIMTTVSRGTTTNRLTFGPTSSKKAAEATDRVEVVEEATAGEAEVTHSQTRTGQFKSHPTLTRTRSPDLSQVHPELLLLDLDQNLAKSNKLLAGRTKHFLPNWQKISDYQAVLQTVTGLEIKWLNKPPHSITIKGPTFSRTENNLIDQEIKTMLDKGAIHATEPSKPQFIGHIFLRPKKDGGMRPVFNMKALNQFIQYKHFKMENLAMLKTVLQKQDYMIKVDLKDAYFCIPVCRKDQQFLRFQWRNKLYQFSCLPFGLTSAPRQFTKLMKPTVFLLRRIGIRLLIYLDDLLILNQNKVQLAKDAHSLIFLLQNLGLVINWGKSVLEPTQELEYLGMLINSNTMELSLPQTKLHDIQSRCKQMLAQDTTTVHKLAQLIGTLTATMQAIHPGPLYYREMQMLKTKQLLHSQTYSAKITLTPKCREELRWWLLHMETWNGKAIMSPGPDMIIQTDASLKGWGAYLEGRPASSGINGLWSETETKLQINCLELKAAELGVRSFVKNKESIHVHLKMDNITALTHINKMGGTKSQLLTQMTKSLWEFCLTKKIHLTAEYLPGNKNKIADALSRQYEDSSNWKLDPQLFTVLNNQWGPLETDLFADRLNAQTTRYFSWKQDPLAAGTDAFLWQWNERCYAFPPFCLIGRCLMKVRKEQTDLVLIAPAWQGQHWYPILLNMLTEEPILIPVLRNTLSSPTGRHTQWSWTTAST